MIHHYYGACPLVLVALDNLVKLVQDPKVAARYLSGLMEGVKKYNMI